MCHEGTGLYTSQTAKARGQPRPHESIFIPNGPRRWAALALAEQNRLEKTRRLAERSLINIVLTMLYVPRGNLPSSRAAFVIPQVKILLSAKKTTVEKI
jgi:hypothetical protein